MTVKFNINKINLLHIDDVLDVVELLPSTEKVLSIYAITYPKDKVTYNIYQLNSVFSISSRPIENVDYP